MGGYVGHPSQLGCGSTFKLPGGNTEYTVISTEELPSGKWKIRVEEQSNPVVIENPGPNSVRIQ